MGQKLSPNDTELYRRVDEVLFYIWDPIGVAKMPAARDEYHSYLPAVFSLLKQNRSLKEVSDYLTKIEREMMGLSGDKKQGEANHAVAVLLEEHKKYFTDS